MGYEERALAKKRFQARGEGDGDFLAQHNSLLGKSHGTHEMDSKCHPPKTGDGVVSVLAKGGAEKRRLCEGTVNRCRGW